MRALFKRVVCYITRNWKQSLLMFLLFFVICSLLLVGYSLKSASIVTERFIRQNLNPIVIYNQDDDLWTEYNTNVSDERELIYARMTKYPLDLDLINKLTSDDRVLVVNAMHSLPNYGLNLEHYTYKDDTNKEDVFPLPGFMIYTNMYPDMIEFRTETFELVQGRMYSQQDIDDANNVCLITEDVLKLNNLSIGDHIQFSNMTQEDADQMSFPEGVEYEDHIFDLEIIGTFRNHSKLPAEFKNEKEFRKKISPYENPENAVLMPFSCYSEKMAHINRIVFDGLDQDLYTYDEYVKSLYAPNIVVMYLKDPLEVDQFVEDYSNDLTQFHQFDANTFEYTLMLGPLNTMILFGDCILWIVIINAVIILFLIAFYFIVNRRYEIGVLLSMGFTYKKILTQLFLELWLIALVSCTAAIAISPLYTKTLLTTAMSVEEKINDPFTKIEHEDISTYFNKSEYKYFTRIDMDQVRDNFQIEYSFEFISAIYWFMTCIILLPFTISSLKLVKHTPKEIMLHK